MIGFSPKCFVERLVMVPEISNGDKGMNKKKCFQIRNSEREMCIKNNGGAIPCPESSNETIAHTPLGAQYH